MTSTAWDYEVEVIPENRALIQSTIGSVQKAANFATISADNVFDIIDELRKQFAKISQGSLEGSSFVCDCNASDILAKRNAQSTQFTVSFAGGRWVLHHVNRAAIRNSKDRITYGLSFAAQKEHREALKQEVQDAQNKTSKK